MVELQINWLVKGAGVDLNGCGRRRRVQRLGSGGDEEETKKLRLGFRAYGKRKAKGWRRFEWLWTSASSSKAWVWRR
ncbi:unnamed protein product [Ilex paraguariensis]|uniref:Uncharacterized protein n=2 Tax=Ilex paraguariensis TaxID=185542 RepID=A0ABC8UU17_9AQUA